MGAAQGWKMINKSRSTQDAAVVLCEGEVTEDGAGAGGEKGWGAPDKMADGGDLSGDGVEGSVTPFGFSALRTSDTNMAGIFSCL